MRYIWVVMAERIQKALLTLGMNAKSKAITDTTIP